MALKPKERARAEKLLAAGYSVYDLELACEGLFKSPHHLGENDRNTEYLELFHALSDSVVDGLIVRGRAVREERENFAKRWGKLPPLERDDDESSSTTTAVDDDPVGDLLRVMDKPAVREPETATEALGASR